MGRATWKQPFSGLALLERDRGNRGGSRAAITGAGHRLFAPEISEDEVRTLFLSETELLQFHLDLLMRMRESRRAGHDRRRFGWASAPVPEAC